MNNIKLNVLHISTFDGGGAGNSAIRLHLGLLKEGVNSKFLCLHKSTTNVPEVYQYPQYLLKPLYFRILLKLSLVKTHELKNQKKLYDKDGTFEAFSFPETDFPIENHPMVQAADVINLHWVGSFLNYKKFFKEIKKPIVWTLHDMNPFLGGFHYLNDLKRNSPTWNNLELTIKEIKKESLNHVKDLCVVTPSKWLGNYAAKSSILGRFPVHHIHYGLDLEVFKPINKKAACEVLGIPTNKKKLFFMAESLLNPRKGFDLLIKAIQQLKNKQDIVLVTVGTLKDSIPLEGISHVSLGHIKDPKLLNIALNAADCFLIPSREDNLPNVMLEALACGIPVISFPTGGMAEVVISGVNGVLAKDISDESLSEAIQDFLLGKYELNNDTIRDFAVNHFSEDIQAIKYMSLYNTLSE